MGIYGKATLTSVRYAEFGALLAEARRGALVEAGILGRRVARDSYQRKYATGPAPSTKSTIQYRTDTKHFLFIYVGTLRGVFKEFGTKVRLKRGQQLEEPFLRPGAAAAFAAILPAVAKRAPGRFKL